MRQISPRIGVALLGAAFFMCGGAAAHADPVTPAALVPALDVYIDNIAAIHAAPGSCPTAKPAAAYIGNWGEARQVLLSSLWADGFPADFVRSATTRLNAVPATVKPDCADRATAAYLADPAKADWVSLIENTLRGVEIPVVTTPFDPEAWVTIQDMVAKDLPAQKRLFDCLAATDPVALPAMVHDWDTMIVKLGAELVGAGLPRDEITTLLSGAEANSLWHRAAPDAAAQLRVSCSKDTAWVQRFGDFSYAALGPAVAKLLPPPAADDSQ